MSADPHAFELATFGRTWSSYRLRTTESLSAVLAPGWFDAVLGHGLKVGDVIELMVDAPDVPRGLRSPMGELGPASFATVTVTAINPPTEPARVVVALLATRRPKPAIHEAA